MEIVITGRGAMLQTKHFTAALSWGNSPQPGEACYWTLADLRIRRVRLQVWTLNDVLRVVKTATIPNINLN